MVCVTLELCWAKIKIPFRYAAMNIDIWLHTKKRWRKIKKIKLNGKWNDSDFHPAQ